MLFGLWHTYILFWIFISRQNILTKYGQTNKQCMSPRLTSQRTDYVCVAVASFVCGCQALNLQHLLETLKSLRGIFFVLMFFLKIHAVLNLHIY